MSIKMPDAVVIGAGPGGYTAAIRLAQLGQRTVLVEKNALGGVCLNVGCIPSKALIYAGSLYEKIQHVSDFGIEVDNVRLDMPKLQGWKNDVVKKLTGGVGQLMKANGVEVIYGRAEFTSPNALRITKPDNDIETLEAKHFIIATGSSPVQIPGFEFNGKTILDSTDALALANVPKTMAVIGGGVIGLEIGILYQKLGTDVTVIEMAPQILPGMDAEIVQQLSRSLKKRKMTVYTGAKAKSAKSSVASVSLAFEDAKGQAQTLDVEKILVAVGRKANTKGLGLDKAGVTLNERGIIEVDAQLRTNVPHIFAIGDVTQSPWLAHKASKEATVAAAVIAGSNEVLDYRAMPAAVFTDPEIATVGLSEEEANTQGMSVKVGKFPFQASGRALSMNQPEGFVKVIADAKTDVVLGVHMIGPDVAELIAEAALAIELGATAEDLALTVHTHPTLPESLMEAAEAVHQKAIHIFSKPAPPKATAMPKTETLTR
ncbi:MAG: dihydrolipoyl dehydrogenase [Vampirovibrionales bacterium]|nr:dihydrolipoyl dehydrogenase [Vampirovibrionales bacterium]